MASSVKVTYLDTAMVVIEVGAFRLLTDPVLDPSGAHFDYGPVQLQKTSAAAATAQRLGRIDAVLLTHDQHGDNLDNAGREYIKSVPLVLTTPLAASRLEGVRCEGLEPWARRILNAEGGDTLVVTAVPAQHGPDGTEGALGPVTGFILEHKDLAAPIYVSGDTIRFSGTEEIARRFAPVGLALLNIGKVQLPALGDAVLSLSADEAASLANSLKARSVVPLHFDGWEHFTEGKDAATDVFARRAIGSDVRWLSSRQTASFQT
jgi:L-ascorbate metabolism protein UlaG (beta-lactamase superfamily)